MSITNAIFTRSLLPAARRSWLIDGLYADCINAPEDALKAKSACRVHGHDCRYVSCFRVISFHKTIHTLVLLLLLKKYRIRTSTLGMLTPYPCSTLLKLELSTDIYSTRGPDEWSLTDLEMRAGRNSSTPSEAQAPLFLAASQKAARGLLALGRSRHKELRRVRRKPSPQLPPTLSTFHPRPQVPLPSAFPGARGQDLDGEVASFCEQEAGGFGRRLQEMDCRRK